MKHALKAAPLLILISVLSSCSSVIKCYVNREYPPVSTIDKRIEATRNALANLDTVAPVIGDFAMTETALQKITLAAFEDANHEYEVNSKLVDSVSLRSVSCQLHKQELEIQASIIVRMTFGKFKITLPTVVSASASPYMASDTLFLNPSFNRVHVQKIRLRRGWLGLRDIRPLRVFIIRVLNEYLDNANALIKNYFVVLPSLKGDSVDLRDWVKSKEQVTIGGNTVVELASIHPAASLMLNDTTLHLLMQEQDTMPPPILTEGTGKARAGKSQLLRQLHAKLVQAHEYCTKHTFETETAVHPYEIRSRISTVFLQEYINTSLASTHVTATYGLSYLVNIPEDEVKVKRPELHCDCPAYCDRFVPSRKVLGVETNLAHPLCKKLCKEKGFDWLFRKMPVYHACRVLEEKFPDTLHIGWIDKTGVSLTGQLHFDLERVRFEDLFSTVDADLAAKAEGRVAYHSRFTTVGDLGMPNFTFVLTGCSEIGIDAESDVSAVLPSLPEVTISQRKEGSMIFLSIETKPFEAPLEITPPPGLAIFKKVSNYFTCGFGVQLSGVVHGLAAMNAHHLFPTLKDKIDLAIKGKCNYKNDGLSFDVPLKVPALTYKRRIVIEPYWFRSAIVGIGTIQ